MIPTNLDALERGALLSPEGERALPRRARRSAGAGDEDESIASFVSRRFGREAYEALVEPLMTGIYGGDGEQLSLRATFPQLRVLELEHGSVLRGLSRAGAERAAAVRVASRRDGLARRRALVARSSAPSSLLGAEAAGVARTPSGFEVELADGDVDRGGRRRGRDPAFVSAELLADARPRARRAARGDPVRVVRRRHARLLARRRRPARRLRLPRPAHRGADVLACTWSSQKWEGRAPDGSVLVRVYAGRFGGRDVTRTPTTSSSRSLATRSALARCRRGADPRARPPLAARDAAVRPRPSGASRADRRRASPSIPGSRVAGAAYRGVGIPDCIRSGELAGGVGRASSRRSPRVTRERSERLFAEALELLPGGVSSPVRAFKAVGGSPLFIERGEGAYLVDVDGNRYVDYVLSWGPLDPRPRASACRRRARGGAAEGHELRRAEPARARARAPHPRRDAEPRARPLRELGHRGDDERAAASRARSPSGRRSSSSSAATTGTRTSSSCRRGRASRRSGCRTRPA